MESSCSLRKDFNSQPHEEADCRSIQRMQGFSYFNSQPHEEADGPKNPTLFFYVISTHSLTKRLTLSLSSFFCPLSISTHSLTKRLTGLQLVYKRLSVYFNSQPHEEADLHGISILIHHDISTHSLTKKLTTSHRLFYSTIIISTHSLTKRLTNATTRTFQPFCISTHSLTKRLTGFPDLIFFIVVFQLTASRRG